MNTQESFYRHVAQTSDEPMGLEVDSARGPYIYTTDGKTYIDFISGIAVSSLGHRHPNVIEAIRKQLDKHLHVMVYGEFIQRPQAQLAELLTSRLHESLDRVYFVNSGTEANEAALKLAKKHTGRSGFLAFNNGYHGDTHGSLSVTGRGVYQEPYKPLLPNVRFEDFNSPAAIEAIDHQTAAVIMEPIQGEGGIIPAEADWLRRLRRRCDETGSLLIFDEIQTGFYRTGTLFAYEYYEVVPDILTMAKAMGGGMPMGALASGSSIFEAFKKDPPLNHVTTFGGHPVSCAAAHANLQTMLDMDCPARASQIEAIARKYLKGPGIVELRGRGAMLGVEVESEALAAAAVGELMEKGIILGWTLHSQTLIRLAPPLIMETGLLEQTFSSIQKTIEKHA